MHMQTYITRGGKLARIGPDPTESSPIVADLVLNINKINGFGLNFWARLINELCLNL